MHIDFNKNSPEQSNQIRNVIINIGSVKTKGTIIYNDFPYDKNLTIT